MKDLGPLAEAEGHRAIYVSFWQEPLAPLAVLLHALETDLKRGGLGERVLRTGRALAPKLKLSMPMFGKAEVDLSTLAGKPPSDLLLHLDDLLGRVWTGIKPTILMLVRCRNLPAAKTTKRSLRRSELASTTVRPPRAVSKQPCGGLSDSASSTGRTAAGGQRTPSGRTGCERQRCSRFSHSRVCIGTCGLNTLLINGLRRSIRRRGVESSQGLVWP